LQFRSLFNKVFGKEKEYKDVTALKLLNGYTNAYTPFSGNAYDDATVRDCIDTIARHFGKMRPKHVIKDNGKIIKTIDDRLNYLLGSYPNELMTASEFLEKVIAQYYTYNNAFIYIKWDIALEKIEALYPLDFPLLEILEDRENNLYARFTFGGGERTVVPYSSIIHIRRHFNRDEIFGDDNSRIMIEDLSTLKAAKASIVNAVKSFTALRGYLRWLTTMRPEDMKKAHDDFVNTYTTNNPSGVASTDNKVEFHELSTKVTTFNSQQMNYVRDNIYKHFGLNENIIMGKYTEDEYIAFYESILEPVAIKLAQEMTDKIFTRRERGRGNEIILESNRLNFMSVASKIKVCETLIPTGGMTINEIRAIFGYAGIEGGDERLISLNFVKAKDQSLYQTGNDDNLLKGGEENEKNGNENGTTRTS
jgi:phage portal protein